MPPEVALYSPPVVLVVELAARAQTVWIGTIKPLSSFVSSTVQSPRPRPLIAAITLLHAELAQIFVKVSATGLVINENSKSESAAQVAMFGSLTRGVNLVRSQSAALATATVAASVTNESFIVWVRGRKETGWNSWRLAKCVRVSS